MDQFIQVFDKTQEDRDKNKNTLNQLMAHRKAIALLQKVQGGDLTDGK